MAARAKKKVARPKKQARPRAGRTSADGSYVRRGRRPAPLPRPTLRDLRLVERDLRLLERGLPLPADRLASYAAMRPSTFRRERHHLGGEADAHLASEVEFWRLREISRSMDRDDMVPGPLVDTSLDLVLGGSGLQMDPDTGSAVLNAAIKDRNTKWASDPHACDVSGKHTLSMLERLALRHERFDGDAFVVLHRDGADRGKIQLLEGDRVAGCDGPDGNVLHGIELEPVTGSVVAYHVLKRKPAERKQTGYRAPRLNRRNYEIIAARNEDGRPNVLQILDPKRVTQNRGVTRWHRVLDQLCSSDDILFAATQGQQVAACIPAFITSAAGVTVGRREDEDDEADADEAPPFEELVPGTVPRLRVGESIAGVTNAGAPANLAQHLTLIWRLVAMQVGLPYSLAFRDTSGTVFHGYRGELDGAKRSAKWIHNYFPSQFNRPIYEFRLELMLEDELRDDPTLGPLVDDAEAKGTLYKVRVQPPAFPYVEPKVDAEGDSFRIEEGLDSHESVLAERGLDADDVMEAQIQFRAKWRKRARQVALEHGEPEAWREYLPRLVRGEATPGAPAPSVTPPATPVTPPPQGGGGGGASGGKSGVATFFLNGAARRPHVAA